MKIREILVPIGAIGIACILAGCIATPYQPLNFMGGVEATPLSSNSERILAEGNGNTRPLRIQQFVLLKAAQDCLAAGYDKFVFVLEDGARSPQENAPPSNGTVRVPPVTSTSTTFPNALRYSINRPATTVVVRFLKVGDPGALDAVDARTTVSDLEPILVGK